MKLLVVLVVGAAVTSQVTAGPIWNRAKKMFGWDKPEDYNPIVAVSPQYHRGGPHGYPASMPSPKGSPYGPPGPPSAPYPSHDAGPPAYGPRPDMQHASSAQYGSYASPSFAGPAYMKASLGPPYGGFQGLQGSSSMPTASYAPQGGQGGFNSFAGGVPDFSTPSQANNYGGLFSVVDQTSQIGQLANGDLTASPSEPYASNEDVMKSLLKMVDKPFDLEAAASGSHYFSHKPQLAINPGPHPIMEADRNVIRYRTSPIQIGVADPYSQHHLSAHGTSGLPTSLGHQTSFDATAAYGGHGAYAASALQSSALGAAYGADLHGAASTHKKNSLPKAH